ncbi:MAG: hypothetical protein LBS83_03800 [Holosporales bacterium]|jgi:hypothetical protein|nr:hypothetical protein [Holosporales bacterium]
MFYKIIYGIMAFVFLGGIIYFGTKGITVAKRSVQVEIPIQNFTNANNE